MKTGMGKELRRGVSLALVVTFCSLGVFVFTFSLPAGATTVAVTEFVGDDPQAGRTIAAIIAGALKTVPGFIIIDRNQLDQVLKEQRLILSGFVDMGSLSGGEVGQLVEVGNLLGATHIVTGSYHRDKRMFLLTINIVSVNTGVIYDTAVVKAATDEYLHTVLVASNRFAKELSGEAITPKQLYGSLDLIVNVEWMYESALLIDPRADLKARIEDATGLKVYSTDITGVLNPGELSSMFKSDYAIEESMRAYADGGGEPLLLVDFVPIEGPRSGRSIKYKARMYWAAYYPAFEGFVMHGVVETPDFGVGLTDAQAIGVAIGKTYDLFVESELYKIIGDFGDVGKRMITVKIFGAKKQDQLSLKRALMDALGVSYFDMDYFTGGVCTFEFEWWGSIEEVRDALMDTGKVRLEEMDNDSLVFRREI